MKLTFIRKDANSGNGNCPALYATDRGTYVVQGKRLPADAAGQLRDLADDEYAVEVPANVIAGIVAGHD